MQERNTSHLLDAKLAFIGCGVMAEAIIAGILLKKLVSPEQIISSHPRQSRREELHAKYGVRLLESNRDAVVAAHPTEGATDSSRTSSIVILAVKPQHFTKVLAEMRGSLHKDQLVDSF